MAYEVQTVTLKGTELLAAASAADRLILAGCAATQTFISQEDAINVYDVPESPYSTTTKVNVEGSENNHLFIYALFVAGESTGGDCKSLYIYGHKESDPTHDYVLAVLSSNTPFHLPIVGEVSNTYGTSLDLVYSVADGAVSSIDSSAFVTRAEFNRLYERAVTTHAYATPTVGEAQDVYGLKTFKNKVSIDYDSGANPNAYISMTRDNYSSDLSGYSYQLNPTYGPSFNAVRGGLSFSTDDHKFETYVNETTNGSEITNAYRLLDEYGQNARTISNITAGAEYDYENGVRYQYGEASIEASESTGTNDASILVRATKDVSEIIVSSDSMDFGVPVVNGSADGFEFNINFTDGSSFIKINDPVLPSSEYDQGVGLRVKNSSGDNNYADIQSFVDSAACISRTGIYGKFGSYYSTIEANSFEDEATVVLISSYNTNDGPYFSRITIDQGSIKLACNSYNNRSKTGYLTFRCFEQSSTFSLVPDCDPGYKVDLGTSADKFGTVYAETYAGTVEQASKDALGNNIDDYINSLITFASGSSGIAPFSLGYSRGNYQDGQLNLSETVANIIGKSMFAGLAFGQVMLAVFHLEQNISEWNSGTKNFTYGYIYDSSETTDNTKLAYYGNLYEFSFGLSIFGRDTTTDQAQYCWSNQFQHSEDATTHFPRKLTGKWLFLNSIYDYHNSSSTASYMPVGYWVVLVVKYGA
jgi:hypothetical protein